MRYLIALLVPPLAVLLCGKPVQAILNAVVWLVGIVTIFFGVGLLVVPVAVIHAMFVVNTHFADKRQAGLMRALDSRANALDLN